MVDEVDERIAALNSERYSLSQNRKKVQASLQEDQILSVPMRRRGCLAKLACVVSKGRSRRDFQQLIAFIGLSRMSAAATSRK